MSSPSSTKKKNTSFPSSSSSSQSSTSSSQSSTSSSQPPPPPPPPSSINTSVLLSNALGSAVAGIIGRCFTHPLDTAKARLQATSSVGSTHHYKGPFDVLYRTLITEGISGLYRGFGTVIIAGTPGTILYLCSYDIFKTQLSTSIKNHNNHHQQQQQQQEESFLVHFVSGLLAEAVACIIYVPVDVIKERLQVQHAPPTTTTITDATKAAVSVSTSSSSSSSTSSIPSSSYYQYRNGYDAFQHILRHEGWKGIYRGYGATLGSFGPFSAFYFMFYEQCKTTIHTYLNKNEDQSSVSNSSSLPFQYTVAASAIAGATASWLTSPLDMAKLRLQVQRGQQQQHQQQHHHQQQVLYRGVYDCLVTTYQQSGIRGLFRGAGARVLHFAPATTITMTCYETCRTMVLAQQESLNNSS